MAELSGRSPTSPSSADHGLRLLRRRLRPRPREAHRPPRTRRTGTPLPAAGLAHPVAARRGRHRRPRAPARLRRQRPARHHARRVGPHLPPPLRRGRRAAGWWSSPPTTARTPRRSTSPTPGADGRAVVDARPQAPAPLGGAVRRARHRGPRRAGRDRHRAAPTGSTRRARRAVRRGRARRARAGSPATCCSSRGGWNPVVHLFSQARGKLRYDAELGAFVPGDDPCGQRRGQRRPASSTLHGASRRGRAGRRGGRSGSSGSWPTPSSVLPEVASAPAGEPATVLWSVPEPDQGAACTRFVDLQRDATVADVLRATGAGHALGRARQALHDDRHRPRPGQDLRRDRVRHRRRGPRRRHGRARARRPSGRRTRRSASRPSPAATAASCTTRSASPPSTTGTSSTAPSSRTSASGSGPGTTPGAARTSSTAVLRECAAARERRRHDGRLHPRQDRRAGPGRRRASSTASTPT